MGVGSWEARKIKARERRQKKETERNSKIPSQTQNSSIFYSSQVEVKVQIEFIQQGEMGITLGMHV